MRDSLLHAKVDTALAMLCWLLASTIDNTYAFFFVVGCGVFVAFDAVRNLAKDSDR